MINHKYKIWIHEDNLNILNDEIIRFNEEYPSLELKYDYESDKGLYHGYKRISFSYNLTIHSFYFTKLFDKISHFSKIVI